MMVKLLKRSGTYGGTTFKRGDIFDISEDIYSLYVSDFEVVGVTKEKLEKSEVEEDEFDKG